MFLSEWREFPSAPRLAGKKNLMTPRVSMLLKSRASLTCFRALFLLGRAKNLSAPGSLLQYATRPQFGISLREDESWSFTIYCTFTLASLALKGTGYGERPQSL